MASKPANSAPQMLDESKLQQLQPPLSVYVTKVYGMPNRLEPVSLPPGKGNPDNGKGQGYDHADVREITLLLARIAGGGKYRVSVTDSSGSKLDFEVQVPKEIPDLLTPDMASMAFPGSAPQVQQAQIIPFQQAGQQGPHPSEWMQQVPPGVPRATQHLPGQQIPQVQGFYQPQPPSYLQTPYSGYFPGPRDPWGSQNPAPVTPLDKDRDRQRDEEVRTLREENIKMRAAWEREKSEAMSKEALLALQQEMRRMSEKPAGPDPALVQVTEALRRLEEDNRRLREEAHRDRGPSEMAQMMTAMMQMQQAQQSQFQNLLPLLLKKDDGGANSTIMLIMETMKQQSESTRAMFSAITEQARERDRNAMTPRDTIDMAMKMQESSGAGSLLKSVVEAYSGVMTMTKGMAELMKDQLGGPTQSPVAGLIGEAIEKAGETVKSVVVAKRDASVADAAARRLEAEAQIAAVQGPQPQRQAPAPAQVQQRPSGFSPPPPVVQVPGQGIDAETLKLFGAASESVLKVRAEVASGRARPEDVFAWVSRAVDQVKAMGVEVPAMKLLEQQQIGDFVEALVPRAAREWKTRLAQLLYAPPPQPAPEEAQGKAEEGGEDVENDEEEDDEEEGEEDE